MKLLLDDTGHVVVEDGKPVYEVDGKRIAFDATGTVATITRLNGEAKDNRIAKEVAETRLKAFDGITDPSAAIKAMATVSNLDQKKLIDAGEVETVKAEITKGFTEKLTASEKKFTDLEANFYRSEIGGAFARSKFVADKIAVPADMLQSQFGSRFTIEDGHVAAHDSNGQKIYSRAKPGELADFEEALEIIVDGYAYKDNILKGNANGGGNTKQSGGGGGGGAKTMTRAQIDALQLSDPAAAMKALTVDKITITE